jgi:hypothetical protein
MSRCVVLACCLATATSAAGAQIPGRADDKLSALLTVVSTDPVLTKCSQWGSESCFRIVLKISASGAREVDIGHIPDDSFRKNRAARAFSGSGASCIEKGGRGLPPVVVWSSGNFTWRDVPFRVSRNKSATLMFEFGCDQQLIPGDGVSIQFSLAVDPDGRSIRTARYTLSDLQLVNSPAQPRPPR